MTPRVRRIVIPLVVLGIALGVVASVIINRPAPTTGSPTPAPASGDTASGADSDGTGESESTASTAGDPPAGATTAEDPSTDGVPTPGADDLASAAPETSPAETAPTIGAPPEADADGPLTTAGWTAVAPVDGALPEPPPLGSFDPAQDRMRVEFSTIGAGIARIAFSDYWDTAKAKRQADRHRRALARGAASPPPPPPEDQRFVLVSSLDLAGFTVPVLATNSIEVNGTLVQIFSDAWSCTGPGRFESEIRDESGTPVLRLSRTFELGADGYDIMLRQGITSLVDQPLEVRWVQYGPTDLPIDRARYIDIRRFFFGYLQPPSRDPSQSYILTDDQMYERSSVLKEIQSGDITIWPNEMSEEETLALSWVGSTNRYFTLTVHPAWTAPAPVPLLLSNVQQVRSIEGVQSDGDSRVFTELFSPAVTLAARDSVRFDLGIYAGPLDPKILERVEPYKSLHMSGLIRYLMSSCCTTLTFAWLANLLLDFLSFLHDYVVFDWGLAIIMLVLIVRALLHPIMKRSQIQMQRVTRGMAELKPEIEKLQKRFKDDPKKLQQEQMKLYREKGINPVGCLTGFVPTLLQTPIWIALYAMLYFAFELRQEPAFFGVFQLIGGWPFLADLSASDHFFWEFAEPHKLLFWNLTGINLIPILMGLVFFVQQKYMTPPPSASMTPEQIQQQKIMKVMMVVLFPVMLYSAPSGLTLYILTSSLIGIVEGKRIRRHVERLEEEKAADPSPKKKKKQDMLGRMYEEALKRAEKRAKEKKAPQKRFKDRRR